MTPFHQSCLAPGFFTMACNVVTSSLKEIHPEMPQWKKDYMATSHKVVLVVVVVGWKDYMTIPHQVILAETLSPTFVGYSFQVR